jgi:hypothetical protein
MARAACPSLHDPAAQKTLQSRWKSVSLPYSKHLDPLPRLFTFTQDIRQSTAIIDRRTDQVIATVRIEVFVKYGRRIFSREGQNQLFLERRAPSFLAPRLHAMYQDGHDFFLVMERIPGRSLDKVLDGLSENDKDGLNVRLREAFDDMTSRNGG